MWSLGRKLVCQIAALVVGLVLLGGVALWGLWGLSHHFSVAEDESEQLRLIYEVGHHAATARAMMNAVPDPQLWRQALHRAAEAIRKIHQETADSPRHPVPHQDLLADLARHLEQAEEAASATGASAVVSELLGQVVVLAERTQNAIVANRQAATERFRTTVAGLALLTGVLVLMAVAVGVSQYRSVMRPLRNLQSGVSELAGRRFETRIEPVGEHEFTELADQFNRMAAELQDLYRELEAKVEAKSRELVRSERLASVGYLAAGVAHEINNPLGIIGGYAEAALRDVQEGREAAGDAVKKALQIVAEEAFRCKEITRALLNLSAGGGREREVCDLGEVATQVVEMLRGYRPLADRRITLACAPARVRANRTELKQVILNLITNALEAVEPEQGEVAVGVKSQGATAILEVIDNGRGMDPQVLERIFEPFFTDKPARDRRGLGLGLSVSHAIVEDHGGRLLATSEGPGCGSRFMVELPGAEIGEWIHACAPATPSA